MFFVSVANRDCFDFLGQIAINLVRNPSGICACLFELTTAEVMDFLPVRGTCQHLSSRKVSMLEFCLVSSHHSADRNVLSASILVGFDRLFMGLCMACASCRSSILVVLRLCRQHTHNSSLSCKNSGQAWFQHGPAACRQAKSRWAMTEQVNTYNAKLQTMFWMDNVQLECVFWCRQATPIHLIPVTVDTFDMQKKDCQNPKNDDNFVYGDPN